MKFVHLVASRCALAAVLLAVLLPALPAAAAPAEGHRSANVININTADAGQLALLPRVGPSVAQRIIDYRKKNGGFKSTDDLMLVQGIGEKTYQLLKPYVATAGESTLKEKIKAGKSAGAKSGGSKSRGSSKKSGAEDAEGSR